MNQDIREISSITFGVLSTEQILNMSVCKIDNPKLGSLDKAGNVGTVYDGRMGTIENGKECETCHQDVWNCPGHFGHIEFNEPIIHPLFHKQVTAFLKCFCIKCFRLLLNRDQIYLNSLNRFKGNKRFEKIIEKLEKIDMCSHCSHPQPEIKYSPADNTISMFCKQKGQDKLVIVLTVDEIKKTFDNVLEEDIELIGFDPLMVHPKNYIMTVFPVLPPCCRPFVIADGNTCDDDLSNQIVEIIKANNHLAEEEGTSKSDSKHQKYLQSLKFRVLTFYNNSSGKAKHTTSGRPIRGLKERLTGKEGQIRTHLMGKRVDQSGRTVIGPDPTLKMGQLAVPIEMAEILTIPVSVTAFNLDTLTKLVNDGKANFVLKKGGKTRINLKNALFYRGTRLMHGDVIVREDQEITVNCGNTQLRPGDRLKRNGEFVEELKYPGKRRYHLEIGDVVERKLRNGDIVLLNRQPTLHKASMMAQEVVIRPYKTLRMNLAITKPFNADFDGDEMNIHVAQSLEAQAELRELSASKHNIISAQDGKPNMAIVQDSLLGVYRMTLGIQKVRKDQFFNISLKLDMTTAQTTGKIKHISKILRQKGKKSNPYHGKGLISLILPDDLIYEKRNNADPNEPVIKIYRGVLYEGTINKSIIGASHNSLIQIMYKEYGVDAAAKFIDGIQFITNNWLLISGFSVGIEDCLIQGERKEEEINDEIQKCFIEAEGIKTTTTHPIIRELRISAVLNKAKDIGLRIAKDALDSKNNFLSTVNSGSKGDFFNIAQITGLLGQQNLQGQRVIPSLNHGKRSLPHYPFGELPVEMEYESKGFIATSFIKGLNPKQFYFHAMSGREGICDTAMGTATSGYMQRRIVKLTEDIKSQYDGTVRDAVGKTYQLSYGGDGLDPVNTVKVKGKHEVCDISRMVARLNMKHELALRPEEEEELSDSDE